MATRNLGKVFMTPKGDWDKTLSYGKLDIVKVKTDTMTSGYIASTDIEANVEITDKRWVNLYDLLNGDVTDEFKQALQKAMDDLASVTKTKDDIDVIAAQLKQMYGVQISDAEPTEEHTGLWIDPNADEVINIPELKDNVVSTNDTWSSQKIYDELQAILTQVTALQSKVQIASDENAKAYLGGNEE